jgi:hypothetical protein
MTKRFRSYEESHRTVGGVKQKLCCRCKKWKDESQFHRNLRSKDGIQWKCKECESKYARKRYNRIRKTGRKNLRYEDRHRIVNEIKQKYCRKCKRWKSENEFYKARSRKDGLMSRCKKCSYKPAKKSRKRRSAVKN